MDFLDKYKYLKDDPSEFGIDLKEFKKNTNELDNNHLSNLLTNSVKVNKEILPKVGEAIEIVFKSDAKVPFDYVAKGMASIQSLGIQKVGIITSGYDS